MFTLIYFVVATEEKPAKSSSRHWLACRDRATRCNTLSIKGSATAVSPEAYITTSGYKTQAAELSFIFHCLNVHAQRRHARPAAATILINSSYVSCWDASYRHRIPQFL